MIDYGSPGKAEVTVGSAERGRDKKVEKKGLPVSKNKKFLSFEEYLRMRREKKEKREAREKSRYGIGGMVIDRLVIFLGGLRRSQLKRFFL